MKSSQQKQTTPAVCSSVHGFGLIQRGSAALSMAWADVSPALAFTPRLMVTVFSSPMILTGAPPTACGFFAT